MSFRKIFSIVFIFLLAFFSLKIFFLSTGSEKTEFISCVDSIETGNYANRQLKFFLYIPEKVSKDKEKTYPLLVCVPSLNGSGERFAGEVFRDFAANNGFVIVAPSFRWDEENWEREQSYQYPAVWSGYALLDIIEKVSSKYGINIDGYYLFGHSAGAQFVLRFAVWQSYICVACAEYGSGGFVTPDECNDVHFLLGIGNNDTKRKEQARWFYNKAKDLGIDVKLKQYSGGHGLNRKFKSDALDFFKRCKDKYENSNPY